MSSKPSQQQLHDFASSLEVLRAASNDGRTTRMPRASRMPKPAAAPAVSSSSPTSQSRVPPSSSSSFTPPAQLSSPTSASASLLDSLASSSLSSPPLPLTSLIQVAREDATPAASLTVQFPPLPISSASTPVPVVKFFPLPQTNSINNNSTTGGSASSQSGGGAFLPLADWNNIALTGNSITKPVSRLPTAQAQSQPTTVTPAMSLSTNLPGLLSPASIAGAAAGVSAIGATSSSSSTTLPLAALPPPPPSFDLRDLKFPFLPLPNNAAASSIGGGANGLASSFPPFDLAQLTASMGQLPLPPMMPVAGTSNTSSTSGSNGGGGSSLSSLFPTPLSMSIPLPGYTYTYSVPTPRRGGGVSCHHCKASKSPDVLYYCTNNSKPKDVIPSSSNALLSSVRRHACKKKYCHSCLQRVYPLLEPTKNCEDHGSKGKGKSGSSGGVDISAWICPSCLNVCICAACVTIRESQKEKREEGLARVEAAAAATTSSPASSSSSPSITTSIASSNMRTMEKIMSQLKKEWNGMHGNGNGHESKSNKSTNKPTTGDAANGSTSSTSSAAIAASSSSSLSATSSPTHTWSSSDAQRLLKDQAREESRIRMYEIYCATHGGNETVGTGRTKKNEKKKMSGSVSRSGSNAASATASKVPAPSSTAAHKDNTPLAALAATLSAFQSTSSTTSSTSPSTRLSRTISSEAIAESSQALTEEQSSQEMEDEEIVEEEEGTVKQEGKSISTMPVASISSTSLVRAPSITSNPSSSSTPLDLLSHMIDSHAFVTTTSAHTPSFTAAATATTKPSSSASPAQSVQKSAAVPTTTSPKINQSSTSPSAPSTLLTSRSLKTVPIVIVTNGQRSTPSSAGTTTSNTPTHAIPAVMVATKTSARAKEKKEEKHSTPQRGTKRSLPADTLLQQQEHKEDSVDAAGAVTNAGTTSEKQESTRILPILGIRQFMKQKKESSTETEAVVSESAAAVTTTPTKDTGSNKKQKVSETKDQNNAHVKAYIDLLRTPLPATIKPASNAAETATASSDEMPPLMPMTDVGQTDSEGTTVQQQQQQPEAVPAPTPTSTSTSTSTLKEQVRALQQQLQLLQPQLQNQLSQTSSFPPISALPALPASSSSSSSSSSMALPPHLQHTPNTNFYDPYTRCQCYSCYWQYYYWHHFMFQPWLTQCGLGGPAIGGPAARSGSGVQPTAASMVSIPVGPTTEATTTEPAAAASSSSATYLLDSAPSVMGPQQYAMMLINAASAAEAATATPTAVSSPEKEASSVTAMETTTE